MHSLDDLALRQGFVKNLADGSGLSIAADYLPWMSHFFEI